MTLQEVCDGRSNMSLQGWNVSSELEEVIYTSRYVVVEKKWIWKNMNGMGQETLILFNVLVRSVLWSDETLIWSTPLLVTKLAKTLCLSLTVFSYLVCCFCECVKRDLEHLFIRVHVREFEVNSNVWSNPSCLSLPAIFLIFDQI